VLPKENYFGLEVCVFLDLLSQAWIS